MRFWLLSGIVIGSIVSTATFSTEVIIIIWLGQLKARELLLRGENLPVQYKAQRLIQKQFNKTEEVGVSFKEATTLKDVWLTSSNDL